MSIQVGFCGLLFIAFLVLKLAAIGAVATWSWWAVTAPLWVPWVIVGLVVLFAAVVAGFAALLS
jgi:hypothetical protein